LGYSQHAVVVFASLWQQQQLRQSFDCFASGPTETGVNPTKKLNKKTRTAAPEGAH
jgi:hypothetical protein